MLFNKNSLLLHSSTQNIDFPVPSTLSQEQALQDTQLNFAEKLYFKVSVLTDTFPCGGIQHCDEILELWAFISLIWPCRSNSWIVSLLIIHCPWFRASMVYYG